MATISTGTLTVNAAFFQEIKEVNQELWQILSRVRTMCEEPAEIRRVSFLDALENLRDHVALHFALEEAYGYFEDPIHVAPRLCEEALDLRDEHRSLYLRLCEFEDHVRTLFDQPRSASRVATIADEFLQFDEDLKQHEQRENALIMEEYGDDIGVGD